MGTYSDNPWAARYEPLLDKNTLRQRALVTVPALAGLRDMPTELACSLLGNALEMVFYPTTQCVNILHRFVGIAHAHCVTKYPDDKAFLAGVYAKESPLIESFPAILLTGLAGIGKTQLMRAFRRIQAEESQVKVDEGHSPFPLKGPWRVTVHARSNPMDILRSLAQADASSTALVDKCKKLVFRDGIPFLIADEFQFVTGSSNANTRVAQMLLLLTYVGIPCCYNANFSLVGRLLKRPEEDRQRLLSDWEILLPDPPSSDDWQQTLKIQKEVAPEILTFDPFKDAAAIHTYTAGRKRATAKLFVLALRNEHSRGTIDLAAIKRAYHSPGYASYREESEILAIQAIQNKPDKHRKDLWCPLPLPHNAAVAFFKSANDKREELVADAEIRASLNGAERKALDEIQRDIMKPSKPLGEIVPLRKKKTAPTADDLKRNNNWFKDQI